MQPKILIFIVAYNAENTVQNVLSRIPDELQHYDTEILIIDDASQDNTFEEARCHDQKNRRMKVTVLANPVNLGYGGNQKVGFQYAIRNGFDLVALLHGDGQYAPEMLPEMVAPILEDRADAVFGSRMLIPGGARKGGMPFYKFVGNKILTGFQNALLKASLSEFHSGYRVYSTAALNRIPFSLNVDDFHFDTEIIIQLLQARQHIVEVPIPTYYGDEICHVNGLKYAFDVFKTTLLARLQHWGVFYQRKFDVERYEDNHSNYLPKLHFDSSHTYAINRVDSNASVLDLGCAEGHVSSALAQKGCQVTAIDRFPPSVDTSRVTFIQADLNNNHLPLRLKNFQIVLLLDVIEHLFDPERFVQNLLEECGCNPDMEIIITTGNVGFVMVRGMLMLGSFNYGKRGILDLTHKRLFTFGSIRRLVEQSGGQVVEEVGIPAPFPLALGGSPIGHWMLRINRWLISLSRGLFAYQILMRVKPKPTLDWLLDTALRESERRICFDNPKTLRIQ